MKITGFVYESDAEHVRGEQATFCPPGKKRFRATMETHREEPADIRLF